MNIIQEQECNILELFKREPKEPFSINMNIHSENTTMSDIFNKIKSIYCQGLMIQAGKAITNTLTITDVNQKHLDIMKRHMLSMGFDVKHRKYSNGDKDCIFRDFLYDIQNQEGIIIKVLSDWNTDMIEKIEVSMKISRQNTDALLRFQKAITKHYEANHFLKLVKPTKLHDFPIIIKKLGEDFVHIIYFDFAKRIEDIKQKLLPIINC
jgi:hypothetical protein